MTGAVVIDCAGDGRARGRAHGEAARDLVARAVARWGEATMAGRRGTPLDHAEGLVSGTGLLRTLERATPDLAWEIRGIAEGAGQPFPLIAALNLMDEQWWHDLSAAGPEPGCSLLGWRADGGTVLCQTMDLPAFMDGSQVVLRLSPEVGPGAVVLSSAGMIGLTGVNAAGVAICVNTLLMLRHDPDGLPVAAVVRGALSHATAAEARRWLTGVHHASGQHYAIAGREGVVGHECSAGGCAPVRADASGALTHTNHPLASDDVDPDAHAVLERAGGTAASLGRLERLRGHGDVDPETLFAEAPICVRPDERPGTETFGAVRFEIGASVTARICPGRPDRARWEEIPLP